MQPHQERVVSEKAELDAKLERLSAFIGGTQFSALDGEEQVRLNRQRDAMTEYSNILSQRIAAFAT